MNFSRRQYFAPAFLTIIAMLGLQLESAGQYANNKELELEIKTNPDFIYIQTKQGDTVNGKENALIKLWESE